MEPNRHVSLTRVFAAPPAVVFNAWIDPIQMAKWWGPTHFTNPVCELDPRPGGAILIHMQAPDGTVFPMKGTFHEVVPSERLVFTSSALEDADGVPAFEIHNTVTFEDVNGQTRLTVDAYVLKADPRADQALDGMEEGWSQSLVRLDLLTGHLATS